MSENETPRDPNEEALVRCETTAGTITMQFTRAWSPNGYDRAVDLFERGFYDGSHFFRVVPHFLVQFGLSYSKDEALQRFAKRSIPDDPQFNPTIDFEEGTISFAGSGDNSRTSQLFISYGVNKGLGTQKWETPIGKVIEGMENARNFYTYGDMPPWGKGPVQQKITPQGGEAYIQENFPKLDKFTRCKVQRTGNPIVKAEQHVVDKSKQSSEQRHLDSQIFEHQKEQLADSIRNNMNAYKDIAGGIQNIMHFDKDKMKAAMLKKHQFHGLPHDKSLNEKEDQLEQQLNKWNTQQQDTTTRNGGLGSTFGSNPNNTINILLVVVAGLLLVVGLVVLTNRKKVANKSV